MSKELERLRALNRALEVEKERLQREAAQLQAEHLRVVTLKEGLEAQLKRILE